MKKINRRDRRAKNRIRRLFLTIFTLALITVFSGFFGGMLTSAQGNTDEKICYISIEIQPGDTLWGIAEEYMPNEYGSVKEYVSELKKINGLTSSDIQAEQYLLVACIK